LVNDTSLPWWQADALEYLLDNTDVDVTTVVYNEHDHSRTKWETLKRGIELREWAVVATLNNALLGSPSQQDTVDIDAITDIDTVKELDVEPEIEGGWKQRFPAGTVSEISENADVAIRFGFGFLVGSILSEFRYGVLSYHHGDLREYRGQPMGFWEFIHDEDTAGITVQRLTDELDAGKIAAIKSVDISDLYTWEAIKHRLFERSEEMLVTAVRSLQNDVLEEPNEVGTLYTLPTGFPVLKFAVKNTKGHILESFESHSVSLNYIPRNQ